MCGLCVHLCISAILCLPAFLLQSPPKEEPKKEQKSLFSDDEDDDMDWLS